MLVLMLTTIQPLDIIDVSHLLNHPYNQPQLPNCLTVRRSACWSYLELLQQRQGCRGLLC